MTPATSGEIPTVQLIHHIIYEACNKGTEAQNAHRGPCNQLVTCPGVHPVFTQMQLQ